MDLWLHLWPAWTASPDTPRMSSACRMLTQGVMACGQVLARASCRKHLSGNAVLVLPPRDADAASLQRLGHEDLIFLDLEALLARPRLAQERCCRVVQHRIFHQISVPGALPAQEMPLRDFLQFPKTGPPFLLLQHNLPSFLCSAWHRSVDLTPAEAGVRVFTWGKELPLPLATIVPNVRPGTPEDAGTTDTLRR